MKIRFIENTKVPHCSGVLFSEIVKQFFWALGHQNVKCTYSGSQPLPCSMGSGELPRHGCVLCFLCQRFWTNLCCLPHLGPLPEPFTNGEIQKVRGPLPALLWGQDKRWVGWESGSG